MIVTELSILDKKLNFFIQQIKYYFIKSNDTLTKANKRIKKKQDWKMKNEEYILCLVLQAVGFDIQLYFNILNYKPFEQKLIKWKNKYSLLMSTMNTSLNSTQYYFSKLPEVKWRLKLLGPNN